MKKNNHALYAKYLIYNVLPAIHKKVNSFESSNLNDLLVIMLMVLNCDGKIGANADILLGKYGSHVGSSG